MQLKRPRPESMEGSDSPSSKRSVSEEPAARTPLPAQPEHASGDELATESAQLDRMELASGPAAASSSSSSPARPSAAEQYELIMPQMKHALEPGTSVYVLKRTWYRGWQSATQPGAGDKSSTITIDEVGPVDNTDLMDEGGRLMIRPQVGQNVIVVTEAVYRQFVAWYGETAPGVKRKVIQQGNDSFGKVEYFEPTLHFCRVVSSKPPDGSAPTVTLQFSILETLGNLKAHLRSHLRLSSDVETRFWRVQRLPPAYTSTQMGVVSCSAAKQHEQPYALADEIAADAAGAYEVMDAKPDSTSLFEAGLDETDVYLAVEQQDDDGNWLVPEESESQASQDLPPARPNFGGGGFFKEKENLLTPRYASGKAPTASTSTATASTSRIATRSQTGAATRTKGLTGLGNLGNTCFMNSALQCLSNTPELQQYFDADVWREELNEDNPLGMSGEIAKAFAEVIRRLWAGNASSYTPREFKTVIGRYRPMFLGYSQQDSQELIAFLLDGLHEDLNRIRKKPYTEIPDWEGEPTPERMWQHAAHVWDLYRRRNDSVMIDLFFGQFRSTLTCLECGKVSYKFDEFSSVTLSLPKQPQLRDVLVVPLDPSKAKVKLSLELAPDASFRDAKTKVATILGLDPKHLVYAEVFDKRIYKWYNDYESISSALYRRNDVLAIMELPFAYAQSVPPRGAKQAVSPVQRDADNEQILVPVAHTTRVKSGKQDYTSTKREFFGEPTLLALTFQQATSYEAVYNALVRQFARLSKRGAEMFESAEDEPMAVDGQAEPATQSEPTIASVLTAPSSSAAPAGNGGMPGYVAPVDAVPVANLFHIFVSEKTEASLAITDVSPNLHPHVDLVKRIEQRRKEAKPAQPIPGAFPAAKADDDDLPDPMSLLNTNGTSTELPADSPVGVNGDAALTEQTPLEPVIGTGDALYIEWSAAARKRFFEDDQGLMADFREMEDPDIAERKAMEGKRKLSLDTCLEDFCKAERLGEDNPWKCPVCNKLQENTSKQMNLWKVPDILVIHLKRFNKTGSYSWSKSGDNVDFPLENWDLTRWVEGRRVADQLKQTPEGKAMLGDDFEDRPLLYDLFAVDNHYGAMGGGHYTAYAKNVNDGRWHEYDDTRVSDVSDPQSVKTSAAYLLFYRRQTKRALGGKTTEIVTSALQSRSVSAAGSDAGGDGPGDMTADTTIDATLTSHGQLTPPDEADPRGPAVLTELEDEDDDWRTREEQFRRENKRSWETDGSDNADAGGSDDEMPGLSSADASGWTSIDEPTHDAVDDWLQDSDKGNDVIFVNTGAQEDEGVHEIDPAGQADSDWMNVETQPSA